MKNAITSVFAITMFLLASCGRTSESDSSEAKEAEYLRKRDAFIERLKQVQEQDIDRQNRLALDTLQGSLREILDGSHFGEGAVINLQSLIDEVGFGMLDGLVVNKDSTLRLFYTSKSLFKQYFKEDVLNEPWPEMFEKIFNSAFESDARVTNFGFVLFPYEEHQAYGMVAVVAQDIGPATPEFLYVFVPKGEEIYMAERWLQQPMKEMPACVSIWTSALEEMKKNQDSSPQDTAAFTRRWRLEEDAWNQYCACYREAIVRDPEFEAIKAQLMELAGLLIDPPEE